MQNKCAVEHAYGGEDVELTLSAEHLWDDFKHVTMPRAGTTADYHSNRLQLLL